MLKIKEKPVNGLIMTRGKLLKYFIRALTALVIVGLKIYYTTATPGGLRWILAPVVFFVKIYTGLPFIFSDTGGYIPLSGSFVIDAGCAGVNYLIIVIALSVFTTAYEKFSPKKAFAIWFFTLLFTYLYTICVNALRITGAIMIQESFISWFPQTDMGNLHFTISLVFYITFIILYYLIFTVIRNKISKEET